MARAWNKLSVRPTNCTKFKSRMFTYLLLVMCQNAKTVEEVTTAS